MRVNLVQGASAGGVLRQASRQFGVPGATMAVDDDLYVGPLTDDDSRNTWWNAVYEGAVEGFEAPDTYTNTFARWREISRHLAEDGIDDLTIWMSSTASDFVFLRMAATQLNRYVGDLHLIDIPIENGCAGVGIRGPDALAKFESLRRPIQKEEWGALAVEFDERVPCHNGVRFLSHGSITLQPYQILDELLLAHCPEDWTKAIRVVGKAMASSFGSNPQNSHVLQWRFRDLVQRGLIQCDRQISPTENWLEMQARLASA